MLVLVKAGRLPWRLARIQMAPDRRGGTGPLHQQTIFPSSLSKAAAQTKADIKIFSINTYIYIYIEFHSGLKISLVVQEIRFALMWVAVAMSSLHWFAQRNGDMNLVKSQSWKEHFDNQEQFNEKHFKKSNDLRRILETAAELKLQPLCRRALQLSF